jgi:hypothetical protein
MTGQRRSITKGVQSTDFSRVLSHEKTQLKLVL